MRFAIGTDEDTPLFAGIRAWIAEKGHTTGIEVVGEPWPDVGRRVAVDVVNGASRFGIVCCWTGTGVAMAANKVTGARAALCTDAETARGARRWNDANILALSLRLTSPTVATEIIEAFVGARVDDGELPVIAGLERA